MSKFTLKELTSFHEKSNTNNDDSNLEMSGKVVDTQNSTTPNKQNNLNSQWRKKQSWLTVPGPKGL